MVKYMQVWDDQLDRLGGIQDRETGAFIPLVEGNRHYAEYLQWVAEGNTPLPAPTVVVDPLAAAKVSLLPTPEFVTMVIDVVAKLKAQNLLGDSDLDKDSKPILATLEKAVDDIRKARDDVSKEG